MVNECYSETIPISEYMFNRTSKQQENILQKYQTVTPLQFTNISFEKISMIKNYYSDDIKKISLYNNKSIPYIRSKRELMIRLNQVMEEGIDFDDIDYGDDE